MKSVLSRLLLLLLPASGIALLETARAGVFYEPVNAFAAGPRNPDRGSLLLYGDGSLYGTSSQGGYYDQGTIFRISREGVVTVPVHFTGSFGAAKGTGPRGALVSDGNGFLWGTTAGGGVNSSGTVFKYNVAARQITTVAEFTGNSPVKGALPVCGLTNDGNGNFWGTTVNGGAGGNGTVFRVNIATGAFTNVAEFSYPGTSGTIRGRTPYAGLVNDGKGFLWGALYGGGTADKGTLFKIEAATGAFTTVIDFTGTSGAAKGSQPQSCPVSDGSDYLWGTTYTGGASDRGTVYKIHRDTGILTTIREFGDAANGQHPYSTLTPAGNDYFWGTASVGGSTGGGLVYKLEKTTGALTKMAEFNAATGFTPAAAPVSDGRGSYWGTTSLGGPSSLGSVYKVQAVTGALTPVVFQDVLPPATGKEGYGTLTEDGQGILWGTTSRGGVGNYGTIFRFDPVTGSLATVIEFTGTTGNVKGAQPFAGMVKDGAGMLWGTTQNGGSGGRGTVFRFNPATTELITVVTFTGTSGTAKGANPLGGLLDEGDGGLLGTTQNGGAANLGTVFKLDTATGTVTTVTEFTGTTGAAKGSFPYCGLASDGLGHYWGTTYGGGATGVGTVFKLDADTLAMSPVVEFTGNTGACKGGIPASPPMPDGKGNVWGTTYGGGPTGAGTLYRIKVENGTFTSLLDFGGTLTPKGANPRSPLLNDGNGSLWGTCSSGGGTGGLGTVFRVDIATGSFASVFEFTGISGAVPGQTPGYGALTLAKDGNLYGNTVSGGVTSGGEIAGYGQIFRIRLGSLPVTLAATGISKTGATLHGTVNPGGKEAEVSFEYSDHPDLSGSTVVAMGTAGAGTTALDFSAPLTGLSPYTNYYYRIRSFSAENPNMQNGGLRSFRTAGTTYEEYAAGFFSPAQLNDPLVSGPGADADGDGAENLLEYALDSNPLTGPAPALEAKASEAGLSVSWHQGLLRSDLEWHAEVSSDLVNWHDDPASILPGPPSSDGNGRTETVTAKVLAPAGAAARAFVRLRVTRLQP